MEKLFQKYYELNPPLFGLNFFEKIKKLLIKRFLLCGFFEKFGKNFVRIDILERLFIMIFNINKNNEVKIIMILN